MQKENKVRFGITMSPELLKRIDEDRGLIPRSTFIEYRLVTYYLLKTNILNICENALQVIKRRTPPEVKLPSKAKKTVFSTHTLTLIHDLKEKIIKIKNLLVEVK